MKRLPAKSSAKKDIVYIGDFCILKSASSTNARSFQIWLEWSPFKHLHFRTALLIWAATCGFQQCGILTSVDSGEPVQPPFKLRNSKRCWVSSLTVIEYSSEQQRLWSDCAYAQAGLSLCGSPCGDPESFVKGGPTLTTFFFKLIRGGRIQVPL